MSVSSVASGASSNNFQTLQSLFQQSKSSFINMLSDVQSGNISGAQSALTSLQQDASSVQSLGNSGSVGQPGSYQNAFFNLISSIQSASGTSATSGTTTSTGTSTTPATGATNSLSQDLAALIQAVQSGSLSGAQQDLTQLQTDATNQLSQLGGHRHHHHHGGMDASGSGSGTGSSTNSSTSAYTAMTNNVQAPSVTVNVQA